MYIFEWIIKLITEDIYFICKATSNYGTGICFVDCCIRPINMVRQVSYRTRTRTILTFTIVSQVCAEMGVGSILNLQDYYEVITDYSILCIHNISNLDPSVANSIVNPDPGTLKIILNTLGTVPGQLFILNLKSTRGTGTIPNDQVPVPVSIGTVPY